MGISAECHGHARSCIKKVEVAGEVLQCERKKGMGSTKLERHDKEVSTSSRTVGMTLSRVIWSHHFFPFRREAEDLNVTQVPFPLFPTHDYLGLPFPPDSATFCNFNHLFFDIQKNLIAFCWNQASELTPRRISTISAISLQLLEDLHYNFTTGTAAKRGGPTLLAPGCARRLMTPKVCRESLPKLKTCTDGWGKV